MINKLTGYLLRKIEAKDQQNKVQLEIDKYNDNDYLYCVSYKNVTMIRTMAVKENIYNINVSFTNGRSFEFINQTKHDAEKLIKKLGYGLSKASPIWANFNCTQGD